jgi:phage gp46-like protein
MTSMDPGIDYFPITPWRKLGVGTCTTKIYPQTYTNHLLYNFMYSCIFTDLLSGVDVLDTPSLSKRDFWSDCWDAGKLGSVLSRLHFMSHWRIRASIFRDQSVTSSFNSGTKCSIHIRQHKLHVVAHPHIKPLLQSTNNVILSILSTTFTIGSMHYLASVEGYDPFPTVCRKSGSTPSAI